MQRSRLIVGFIACLALSASLLAGPAPDAISVNGTVDKPGDWTVARLKSDLASDVTTITYTIHGQKHTSTAIPLLSLLKASGIQTELKADPTASPKTKHFELRLAVIVEGRDGYVTTFALAELMAELGNRPVWLALDVDGQSLSSNEGPIKLIVPDDANPARWVHAVQTISVLNITKPNP